MGTFTYNGTLTVEFEDRLLAHLQWVIMTKLRRNESFIFSWTKAEEAGGGRTSVWIDRHIPVVFDYPTSVVPEMSREWATGLMNTTFQVAGLQIIPDQVIAEAGTR
ncbi:ATP-dependent DNA ligase [Agromyces sp. NPDC058484]|uniref:DUF7882 family protein n=1 Tax=Agromyces sp. NPDC058484 TaxID=3346524 RepID=UPI00365194F9